MASVVNESQISYLLLQTHSDTCRATPKFSLGLLGLRSSYGILSGTKVCSIAQRARPLAKLLLKSLTSTFCQDTNVQSTLNWSLRINICKRLTTHTAYKPAIVSNSYLHGYLHVPVGP